GAVWHLADAAPRVLGRCRVGARGDGARGGVAVRRWPRDRVRAWPAVADAVARRRVAADDGALHEVHVGPDRQPDLPVLLELSVRWIRRLQLGAGGDHGAAVAGAVDGGGHPGFRGWCRLVVVEAPGLIPAARLRLRLFGVQLRDLPDRRRLEGAPLRASDGLRRDPG